MRVLYILWGIPSFATAFVPSAPLASLQQFSIRHNSSPRRTALFVSETPYASPPPQEQEKDRNQNEDDVLRRQGIFRNKKLGNIVTSARKLFSKEEVGHTLIDPPRTLDTSATVSSFLTPDPIKRDVEKKSKVHTAMPNLTLVKTSEEFRLAVGLEKDKLVVVRFYATWCKVKKKSSLFNKLKC
uniref:Thioredoxin domain-containing protein n=1 Tax=Corethron hystrix TaxID=216773 RepID=A0A7S1B6T9_9STRA|mmetsp:Transcript_14803/g.32802  ORF Transcript_14803/g.32802 Transcript_14803/m.32802 type:complete len:184 (+) Transcript_14803:515-1066(+)